MILLEYQNIKTFLLKAVLYIDPKTFSRLKKLKTLCHGHMSLVILTEKKLLELFTKKKIRNTNQKRFRVEKAIKKDDKLYFIWEGYANYFNGWFHTERRSTNE